MLNNYIVICIAIAMVFAFGSLFFGIFLEPEKVASKK